MGLDDCVAKLLGVPVALDVTNELRVGVTMLLGVGVPVPVLLGAGVPVPVRDNELVALAVGVSGPVIDGVARGVPELE